MAHWPHQSPWHLARLASLADVCCYWSGALGEREKHTGTFSPGPAVSGRGMCIQTPAVQC